MSQPSFWAVARRPKWIGGLVLAMLVAVSFSLLMQWQLSRTFNTVGVSVEQQAPVPLADLMQPSLPLTTPVFDRLVLFEATLDPTNTYVVEKRLQLLPDESVEEGYWLLANSFVEDSSLTLALGFSKDLALIEKVQGELEAKTLQLVGYLEPSEAAKTRTGEILGSVALGQLINLYSDQELAAFPAYVVVSQGFSSALDPISIGIRQQQIEINWLTAFYAVEWAFFALAAFYLWWRMVMDQRIRETQ